MGTWVRACTHSIFGSLWGGRSGSQKVPENGSEKVPKMESKRYREWIPKCIRKGTRNGSQNGSKLDLYHVLASSLQVLFYPLTSRHITSHLIFSHLISSLLISSHLLASHLIFSHLISSHRISSSRISSHLISSHLISKMHSRSASGSAGAESFPGRKCISEPETDRVSFRCTPLRSCPPLAVPAEPP